tara:strand:- start:53 stop:253 length:201 start_codon:yes stop_codon:yes gene_type:complete
MVEQNGAGNEYGLTSEDISAAFQAHPQAAQAAQISLLRRVIESRDNEISVLKQEIEDLLKATSNSE